MSKGPIAECMQYEVVSERKGRRRDEGGQGEGESTTCPKAQESQRKREPAFPIMRRATLKVWLREPTSPTVLVAFEFSGAMRSALERAGKRALSVDMRPSERPGPHFQGELRDVLDLKHWEAVYFVGPNCYQMLRGDVDCLPKKMEDGRTFWAIAFLLFCLCCSNTDMLLVEQPDTVAHDYIPLQLFDDLEVHEWRTTNYGDEEDKFMRLTTRNMCLPPPPYPTVPREAPIPRSQFQYATPEERDRRRSSWARFPRMCDTLAKAVRKEMGGVLHVGYPEAIEWLAHRWHQQGHKVPLDYNNADAQPSSEKERRYQLVRGPGDGQEREGTVPKLTRGAYTEAVEAQAEHSNMELPEQQPMRGYPRPTDVTKGEERSRATRKTKRGGAAEELEAAPHEEAGVVVVPVHATERDIEVLMPTDPDMVLSLPEATEGRRGKPSITQAAESSVCTLLGLAERPIGMRVGTTEDGRRAVATVIEAKGKVESTGLMARDRRRKSGLVALAWCTMSMLATTGGQSTWGRIALCTMRQYQEHGAHTMWYHQAEDEARLLTGARPGKGPLQGPERQRLREGGGVKGRDLINMAITPARGPYSTPYECMKAHYPST